jgi:ribosome biogenesis protein ENP2
MTDLKLDDVRQRLPGSQAPRMLPKGLRLAPVQGQSGSRFGPDRGASFGQRRMAQGASVSHSNKPSHASRGTADGGAEISWIPSAGDAARHAAEEALEDRRAAEFKGKKAPVAKPPKRKGVESFGAGMERGGQDPSVVVSESDRQGRTERRKGMRSGSKNTIFSRK